MGGEGKKAAEALQEIGINAAMLRGQGATQQFIAIADAMSKVTDENQKAAVAAAIFGKSWGGLADLLGQTKTVFAEMAQEAKRQNAIVADSSRKTFDEYERNVKNMQTRWEGFKRSLVTRGAPAANLAMGIGEGLLDPEGMAAGEFARNRKKRAFHDPAAFKSSVAASEAQFSKFIESLEAITNPTHATGWLNAMKGIATEAGKAAKSLLEMEGASQIKQKYDEARDALNAQGEEMRKLLMGEKEYQAELMARAGLEKQLVQQYKDQFDIMEDFREAQQTVKQEEEKLRKAEEEKQPDAAKFNEILSNQKLAAFDAGFLTRAPGTDRSGETRDETPETKKLDEAIRVLREIEKKTGIKPNVNAN
jgi:hypothetical protein